MKRLQEKATDKMQKQSDDGEDIYMNVTSPLRKQFLFLFF